MKRNQVIAAMNALPEDCDVEFGVIPLEKQVEMMTFMANFLTLASMYKGTNYDPEQRREALVDIFKKLGYGKEAAYVVVSSAAEFDKRFKEASDNCMQSLARLAMQ